MTAIQELEKRIKELEQSLGKKSKPEIKKYDLTFAQALQLLQDKKAKKISCWHGSGIWVYLNTILMAAMEGACRFDVPYLFCQTAMGNHVIWMPNSGEMLQAKWRVIE